MGRGMTMNDRSSRLAAAMTRLPLVAILRGLRPQEAATVGHACRTPTPP
jgi:hypothetical protein